MMYYAITVNADQIITGVHESVTPITPSTFAENPSLAEDTVVAVETPNDLQAGIDVRCFNEDGTSKPIVWCIENGYMELPPYAEIIDGELICREMPPEEAPLTLEEYFATMVNEAKAEAKALVDAVQEEAYQQVTQAKEALGNSLAEVNGETEQKFAAMRPIMTDLVRDKPADLVISASQMLLPWTEGEYILGDVRTWEGQPRRCCQAHDSTGNPTWTPATASLWAPFHAQSVAYALPWVPPTGAHDMYKAGEYMVWTDDLVYKCQQDTAYSPLEDAGAWQRVS